MIIHVSKATAVELILLAICIALAKFVIPTHTWLLVPTGLVAGFCYMDLLMRALRKGGPR